jgi:hypothetical protein
MLRIEREEGWEPSTQRPLPFRLPPYGPRFGVAKPLADRDQRGQQTTAASVGPFPVATLDHVEILRRIPGGVLDAGRKAAGRVSRRCMPAPIASATGR